MYRRKTASAATSNALAAPRHIVIDARIRRSSTGRYADRLIEHLQTIDTINRYTIFVQPDDPWQPRREGTNFTRIPCPFPQFSFNPFDQLRFAWRLYRLRPDLVHFTMTQQPLLYFGNIVTTTHDLTMLSFVRRGTTPLPIYRLKMAAYRFLFRWSNLKSKKIITPSYYVAEELISYQRFVKNKVVVTHEASEPKQIGTSCRPKAIPARCRFIMYLGNAFPHKNVKRLVRAFIALKDTNPDLHLVLVGKTDIHYRDLQAYVNSLYEKNDIHITGYLPDEEAAWLYEHCEAYVFPSLSEGFGLPGLEAMTYGAPVVSGNATSLPEIYGDAAHYFNARSTRDIAERIDEVLHDKALRERLRKAGKEQIAKYSWQITAENTLSVYRQVLGK